jgi:hypothetical protein
MFTLRKPRSIVIVIDFDSSTFFLARSPGIFRLFASGDVVGYRGPELMEITPTAPSQLPAHVFILTNAINELLGIQWILYTFKSRTFVIRPLRLNALPYH